MNAGSSVEFEFEAQSAPWSMRERNGICPLSSLLSVTELPGGYSAAAVAAGTLVELDAVDIEDGDGEAEAVTKTVTVFVARPSAGEDDDSAESAVTGGGPATGGGGGGTGGYIAMRYVSSFL